MTRLLVASTAEQGGLRLVDTTVTDLLAREHSSWVGARDSSIYVLAGSDEGRLLHLDRPTGALIAEYPVGEEPCHAAISPDGRMLVTADYTSGTLSVFARDLATGTLELTETIWLEGSGSGVVPDRQEAPHPHHVLFLSDTELLVNDLGSDAVVVFGRSNDRLTDIARTATPPGSGPRHSVLMGTTLVVSAELSNEVVAAPLADVRSGAANWSRQPASLRGASALHAQGTEVTYPGDVARWGSHVAVANRGAGTVGLLEVTADDAVVWNSEIDAGGEWPQHLAALVGGDLLVAQPRTDELVRVDPAGDIVERVAVPAPSWIVRDE